MKLNHYAIVALITVLSGCASTVPLNFSVPNVAVTQKKIDAEMKSLTVTVSRPDEKTGVINMNPTVPNIWQTSLAEAINKEAIFQDDAPKKIDILVKILSFDPPSVGIAMTTTTSARYEIIDRKTGAVIFTKDISSSGTTPFSYSVVGTTRQVESANRAVQNNIAQFLQVLETVDLQKPMTPVKVD